METLYKIIQEYLEDFNQKKACDFVVKPSIPIVWFGNLEKYSSAKGKIVTVALNPSLQEFPVDAAPRFNVNAVKPQELVSTLNRYFLDNPLQEMVRVIRIRPELPQRHLLQGERSTAEDGNSH